MCLRRHQLERQTGTTETEKHTTPPRGGELTQVSVWAVLITFQCGPTRFFLLGPGRMGLGPRARSHGPIWAHRPIFGGYSVGIFVGLEELSYPGMAIGACGLMNAVGNLRPRVLVELCEAIWNNDLKVARSLHERLLEVNQAVFFETNPIPIKYMMKRLGLIQSNDHRLPMSPAPPELERRLDQVLDRAGLL